MKRVRLANLDAAERRALVRRSPVPDRAVRERAAQICEGIRTGGDEALAEASAGYGGGSAASVRVPPAQLHAAVDAIDPPVVDALRRSISHVEAFHRAQLPRPIDVETAPGVTVSRVWSPLRRIGAYVPGGKAAYPSTLIMTTVPAKIAGVEQIAVATPADERGEVATVTLAAAALVGITEVYAMGGAQAIGALAYGTESVPAVQKIVGPGNQWVTAAKLAVFGDCGIDLPAGPSEVLVLADDTAEPELVAADLLCQAEHGPESPAVLVTTDEGLAGEIASALTRLLGRLERSAILSEALEHHGLIVIAASWEDAIDFANAYAPEHLSIVSDDPERDAKAVTSAGSVYVGRWSPESAGDYATGANHVLPTGGLPASYGPLSTEDFGSWRQIQRMTESGLAELVPTITSLAEAEGLAAHALAATIRFAKEAPS